MMQERQHEQLHVRHSAAAFPDHPAIIDAESGRTVSFGELARNAGCTAGMFRARGLGPGGRIALLMGNIPEFIEVCWAARQIGADYTPVSVQFKLAEAAAVVNDCEPDILIADAERAAFARELLSQVDQPPALLVAGGAQGPFESYETARDAAAEATALAPAAGQDVLYSSGTTGLPKATVREIPATSKSGLTLAELSMIDKFGLDRSTVHLCTVPLYHALGLRLSLLVQACGGTCVLLKKFDPALALRALETYRCTHSVWVPTMFVRMLKLPVEVRGGCDVTSLKLALHAAAPCPVGIKEEMIAWWGPIITEFLASTEEAGYHLIFSDEWLTHKGSVGRCLTARVHILDENGNELPPGKVGIVHYEAGPVFRYRNAPDKTAESFGPHGWRTVGDLGYLDEDGYLYVTGRRGQTINTGGVKVEPREIEDVLILHPAVADLAVIGVPHPEFGHAVIAIVQPADAAADAATLSRELLDHCRSKLSGVKCPKRVLFQNELPRAANGKLYRRELEERYKSEFGS